MDRDPIVVAGMARTPMGSFQGSLQPVTAPELGSAAIRGALDRAAVASEDVNEVFMGCVLPAAQGQAPARQAAIGAGIPVDAGATTINKMCGSGMRAAMFAHDALAAGSASVVVAGGLESMSNAPYLLPKARGGLRMGHAQVQDHMFIDGLEDAYEPGKLMGHFAEATAQKYQFTRAEQDEFAIRSLTRARIANEDGTFADEMVPVTVKTRKGASIVDRDEQPFSADLDKIPRAPPRVQQGRDSDGGELELHLRWSRRTGHDAPVRSRTAWPDAAGPNRGAGDPQSGTGMVHDCGRRRLFARRSSKQGGRPTRSTSTRSTRRLPLSRWWRCVNSVCRRTRSNVHGGACALGHPVGASGARIMATLITALRKYDLDKGVASLCIGGGEATAVALERVH